jgi:hypothetical protein
MFEKWRDPMFIDTAHHHYRLRLEIDAFVGAIITAGGRVASAKNPMTRRATRLRKVVSLRVIGPEI